MPSRTVQSAYRPEFAAAYGQSAHGAGGWIAGACHRGQVVRGGPFPLHVNLDSGAIHGWRARLINVITFWLASVCIIACVTYPYSYRWSGVDAGASREWVSPTGSLGTFGGHWRMNDFFYSYVRESLREPVPMFTARVGNSIQSRPMTMMDGQPLMDISSLSPDSSSDIVVIVGSEPNPVSPWYVILPLSWRQELKARMTKVIDQLKLRSYAESAESDLDFVLRIAFAFLYLLITLVLCLRSLAESESAPIRADMLPLADVLLVVVADGKPVVLDLGCAVPGGDGPYGMAGLAGCGVDLVLSLRL